MKESSMEAIAKKLNVSPSLVSRVLRHCSGVDSDTRHRILAEAQNYAPIIPEGEYPIYAIFPDTPRYFWEPMRRGFVNALSKNEIPFKTNIYTKVHDEAAILEYLNEAEQLNVRAVIIATYATPAILDKLKKMEPDRFILFLSEYGELPNTFYCGSDSYQEGYLMGQYYVSHFKDRKLMLLSLPEDSNYVKRMDGFLKAVSESDSEILNEVIRIKLERKILTNYKLIPSKLAPLLLESASEQDSYCLYSPGGIPQLPLAIAKARLTDRMVLLCQDCYPDDKSSCQIITCNQDCYTQGKTAALLATTFIRESLFPDRKKILVPSRIRVLSEMKDH